jgi:hypothetical protein
MFALTGHHEDDLQKYKNVTLCKYKISGVNLNIDVCLDTSKCRARRYKSSPLFSGSYLSCEVGYIWNRLLVWVYVTPESLKYFLSHKEHLGTVLLTIMFWYIGSVKKKGKVISLQTLFGPGGG